MRVRLSGALLRFVDYRREIEIEALTVGEALEKLVGEHPSLKPVLYDGRGQVRGMHRLFIGGKQLDSTELTLAVKPNDRIDVITNIAGG